MQYQPVIKTLAAQKSQLSLAVFAEALSVKRL